MKPFEAEIKSIMTERVLLSDDDASLTMIPKILEEELPIKIVNVRFKNLDNSITILYRHESQEYELVFSSYS